MCICVSNVCMTLTYITIHYIKCNVVAPARVMGRTAARQRWNGGSGGMEWNGMEWNVRVMEYGMARAGVIDATNVYMQRVIHSPTHHK